MKTAQTVQCFDCSHFTVERHGKALDVAPQGLGACAFEQRGGHYVAGSYMRTCTMFEHGPRGARERVEQYWNKLRKRYGL